MQKKAAEFNFRNQLKVVKKKEFTLEEEEKESVCVATIAKLKFTLAFTFICDFQQKKPDWSKGKPGDAKVKEEAEPVEA